MLQQTISRLDGLDKAPAMLICNENHRFIAAEQLRQLNEAHNGIILEPVGRNTAPAIALAAIRAVSSRESDELRALSTVTGKDSCEKRVKSTKEVQLEDNDPVVLVLAADHVIMDDVAFQGVIKHAQLFAEAGKMVTFGIVATGPETGYGYVRRGKKAVVGHVSSVEDQNLTDSVAFEVSEFVEKPDLVTAQAYVDGGVHYWNSGMFMFKASRYLAVLKEFRPDIYSACELAMQSQQTDNDFVRVDIEAFKACPDESIDYAVMEPLCKQANGDVVIVPLDAGWSDVGGFASLWEVLDKDNNGNTLIGDVQAIDTTNTLVMGEDKLVATVGVDNLVIINTKDALLVAHKDKAQEVKAVVNALKAAKRSEVTEHREVYRPWGKYDSIDSGERFQVKRITVKPGAKLSIQMHHHRAEHWVVVSGTAKVTKGDEDIILTENQSIYIPLGTVHALENPGVIPLELIEVQSGSYLGEDDIVRFEDRYGRESET
jgi:mannose-1-phosphate guanylyltransferase/mannose-6-phosphate isomerase